MYSTLSIISISCLMSRKEVRIYLQRLPIQMASTSELQSKPFTFHILKLNLTCIKHHLEVHRDFDLLPSNTFFSSPLPHTSVIIGFRSMLVLLANKMPCTSHLVFGFLPPLLRAHELHLLFSECILLTSI